jgi:allophanate hydrolase
MNKIEFPRTFSIQWLREKYLNDETTPEEIVSEIIRRTHRDADMNIWITPPTMAMVKPYLDRLRTLDQTSLPLWGIPFAIKDNIDLAGAPTTAGCFEYTCMPDGNAGVVERLIAAGAIPLGKTNLDQFATGLVGTRSPYGETHNAFQPELISGGSSSGSAVAVARGHAAFALGTDTAGSGRVPAALNRLIGYKPSLGAWPVNGVIPACESLDCVTVFTHNLQDALMVDQITRGIHEDDPWSKNLPHPLPKLPQKICLPNGPLEFYGPFAKEYETAWETTVHTVRKMNIPIEYVDTELFEQAGSILYEGPWIAERWTSLGEFIDTHPGATLPVTEEILRSGVMAGYDAASLFHVMHRLQSYKAATRKMLKDAVLVMPTAGGTWSRKQLNLDPIGANRAMGRFTNHCNLLDLCAVALPSEDAALNLPFGITLFANSEREDLIFGAGEMFVNLVAGTEAPNLLWNENRPVSAGTSSFVAVCGLHMRGYPLEKQMLEIGAKFVREAITAAKYQLVKLHTVPAKPGLIKKQAAGSSIHLEIWEMPVDRFGSFVASIPAPLGIGKIELQDGSEVTGFVCEAYAALGAEDISAFGGWRNLPA